MNQSYFGCEVIHAITRMPRKLGNNRVCSTGIQLLHLMRGQPGHNTRPRARLSPSFLGMDGTTGPLTSQLNVTLTCKLQCRYLIPALNAWAARAGCTTTCPIATQFSWDECMDDLTTGRSFHSQATRQWALMCLAYLPDMSSLCVCTTRHMRPVDWCKN